jgi:tetratricopeptide (TPR) repeat protein
VKGELSVKRGDAEEGVDMLRRALEVLHADRYELLTTAFNSTLAEGFARLGRMDEALATVDETIALVERSGDMFNLPELLRIKGEFLVSKRRRRRRSTSRARLRSRPRNRHSAGSCARLRASYARGGSTRTQRAGRLPESMRASRTALILRI